VNSKLIEEIAGSGPAQLVELPELTTQVSAGSAVLDSNLHLLQGVKLKLTVVVGEVNMTLGELMDLREQSILRINRPVDSPVDILVDENVVARGHLVAVGDHFGVRVNQIATPG
jgi:flagellar motor switch protein FliN/FliY